MTKKKKDIKLEEIKNKYKTKYPIPISMKTWGEKMEFLKQIKKEIKEHEITKRDNPIK